jgi:hypothetical protein
MTLLSEIQGVLERTYGPIGINLEDCLIGPGRCSDLTRLAGGRAAQLAPGGRTFLRQAGDRLYLAIFYSHPVILELERHNPREVLNEKNIAPLITFVEEIAHGIQAALLFGEGERGLDSENFARNLEVQAKIDTYLVLCRFARFLCGRRIPLRVRRWLAAQLFDESYRRFASPRLRERYRVTQRAAEDFLGYLRTVRPHGRAKVLREFRALSWKGKQRWLERA